MLLNLCWGVDVILELPGVHLPLSLSLYYIELFITVADTAFPSKCFTEDTLLYNDKAIIMPMKFNVMQLFYFVQKVSFKDFYSTKIQFRISHCLCLISFISFNSLLYSFVFHDFISNS